jgi:7-dehydrocholesterol reductase
MPLTRRASKTEPDNISIQKSTCTSGVVASSNRILTQKGSDLVPEDANRSLNMFEAFTTAFLLAVCPTFTQTLAFITNSKLFDEKICANATTACSRSAGGFWELYTNKYASQPMGGFDEFWWDMVSEAYESFIPAIQILVLFNGLALLLYWYRGTAAPVKYGPVTPRGARPDYIDNGVAHCIIFTLVFLGLSDFSKVFGIDAYFNLTTTTLTAGFFELSVIFHHFQGLILVLNIFGLLFCLFLYFKGSVAPSGPDHGSSGNGVLFDYYWGMELYPRIFDVDVKRFVNCRFSMTFWQLAGISFLAASIENNKTTEEWFNKPGLVFTALSQYIYLFKFFWWEIGYMRSIDIIVDRAGFYETWGCLVWVPSLYTLHTRLMVNNDPQHSLLSATLLFIFGTVGGVLLNFWADSQRQWFREADGKCTVWGAPAKFIRCQYKVKDPKTGKFVQRKSLLLASGFWGTARHFQYLFELMAAWSWCLLATNFFDEDGNGNGWLPLSYCIFLTILLVHRAERDEIKCLKKYGDGYREYMKLVPYKIIPGVY